MTGSKNFTLLELLICIAIISLLGSLLLPALSESINRAKLAACSSNMRSAGYGINLYCADNSGYIPNNIPGMETSSIPILRLPNWEVLALGRLLTGGYLTDPGIFGCPDTPGYTENDLRRNWQEVPMAWTAYLYRAQACGFAGILASAENNGKAMLIDFACLKPSGNIVPHNFHISNILYSDGHVESHPNSPVPMEYYTVQAETHGEIAPDCTEIWLHADIFSQ